jgi:intracellular multiplication protein IcmL
MFKNILLSLDKPGNDVVADSIDKQPIVSKYWFNLGGSIVFILITLLVGFLSIIVYDKKSSPVTYAINLEKKTKQQIIVLPFPHQSFKNVSGWIVDAVSVAYSFDFLNYDKQVKKAAYYFTPEGYNTYLTALEVTKIQKEVVGKKLQISLIPLQNPILVNGGTFGETQFWRFKLPVLVSYYGGKEPVIKKLMVELLVLRVPAHENYKGLAIAEFNMTNYN